MIQPALDASSPGDTILIGPGRFTETHLVETMSWTELVNAEVKCDSIRSSGWDNETIISQDPIDKVPPLVLKGCSAIVVMPDAVLHISPLRMSLMQYTGLEG